MNSDNKKILSTTLTALAVGLIGFFACWFVLNPIFNGSVTLPRYIPLGPLHIQFYGVLIAIAALSGYWLILKRRVENRIDGEDAENLFFIVLVSGFIGARIYHVISEFSYYLDNISQTIAVWNGGLSIYGAAIGGVLGILFYLRKHKKYSLLQILDWMVPGLVLGQLIGRFGNFVNYEIYGNPTNLPWKMFVPVEYRLSPFEVSQFFHPLFLYEAAGSAVILVLLLRLKLRKGYLFLLWLFLYNVLRFLLEFIRVGSVTYGNIRINAIVSLVLAGLAIYFWYHIKHRTEYDITTSHNN